MFSQGYNFDAIKIPSVRKRGTRRSMTNFFKEYDKIASWLKDRRRYMIKRLGWKSAIFPMHITVPLFNRRSTSALAFSCKQPVAPKKESIDISMAFPHRSQIQSIS